MHRHVLVRDWYRHVVIDGIPSHLHVLFARRRERMHVQITLRANDLALYYSISRRMRTGAPFPRGDILRNFLYISIAWALCPRSPERLRSASPLCSPEFFNALWYSSTLFSLTDRWNVDGFLWRSSHFPNFLLTSFFCILYPVCVYPTCIIVKERAYVGYIENRMWSHLNFQVQQVSYFCQRCVLDFIDSTVARLDFFEVCVTHIYWTLIDCIILILKSFDNEMQSEI